MRPAQLFPSPVGTLSVMGTTVQNLISAQQSHDQLALCLIGVPKKGMGVPSHVHAREEEHFHVLKGRVMLNVGGVEHVLGPGQTGFGPRDVVHSWEALTDDVQMIVAATPAGLDEMFVELDAADLAPNQIDEVIAICRKYEIEFL